jgi:hypothetical protein
MSPWRYGLVVLIVSTPVVIRIPEMLINVSKLHPETQWTFLGLMLPFFAFAIYFYVMYYKLYIKPQNNENGSKQP